MATHCMERVCPVKGRLFKAVRTPLFWIVLVSVALRLPGLTWGLPASDGWDDDGVAPRNFLVGLAQTYIPGSYFTYPPLHMLWLALLSAPGVVLALLHAPTLSQHDVIGQFIHVPYMTFFAITARVLSIVMSVGTLLFIGQLTETFAGRKASLYAAAACALDAPLVYYGQVTNLDGPYLFWASLALWGWVKFLVERQPRHLRWVALASVAAITTKDQAYAVFLLALPISLVLWFSLDSKARQSWAPIARSLTLWATLAGGGLLLIDGAITNPSGFSKRLAFLLGPASQDYTSYTANLEGRFRLLADMVLQFPRFYPAVTGLLIVMGFALIWRQFRHDPAKRVAALVPALAALSFTVCFNLLALRSDNRFLLPQSVFVAPYIGMAAAWLTTRHSWKLRYAAGAGLATIACLAVYQCLGIDAALINDPRYDMERWVAAHMQPNDYIEAYGRNAFLPRLPDTGNVARLDINPLKRRNPLPGVTEKLAPFDQVEARDPRFLIIPDFWVADYLRAAPPESQNGRKTPRVAETTLHDTDNRAFFQKLFAGEYGYRLAHVSRYAPGPWPAVEGFESLGQTVYLFERATP